MKTFTVMTESGSFIYQVETQAGALRQHTQERPTAGVLSIAETSTLRAHADAAESLAD